MLDAPRELVWKCFTDPAHMKQWWGPKGVKIVKSEMDLRPGGTYHYGMQTPDGSVMWGKQVYREIVPPERLVFINSFSDEKGGLTRHPMAPTWPLEMLSVFTFEEQPGGKTKFTVRWSPHNATEEERKTFDAGHASMNQGWSGTMDQLEAYLAKQGETQSSLPAAAAISDMEIAMNYVDGFVIPVQKKKLAHYRSMAKLSAEGLAGAWRAGVLRKRRRRRAVRQAHLVSAQREAQARRDGGVLLDHLQVARASRQGDGQGDEGPAHRQDDAAARRRSIPSA